MLFLHNVSGVKSTPVSGKDFVVITEVFMLLLYGRNRDSNLQHFCLDSGLEF